MDNESLVTHDNFRVVCCLSRTINLSFSQRSSRIAMAHLVLFLCFLFPLSVVASSQETPWFLRIPWYLTNYTDIKDHQLVTSGFWTLQAPDFDIKLDAIHTANEAGAIKLALRMELRGQNGKTLPHLRASGNWTVMSFIPLLTRVFQYEAEFDEDNRVSQWIETLPHKDLLDIHNGYFHPVTNTLLIYNHMLYEKL